jgi:hypothetical protein
MDTIISNNTHTYIYNKNDNIQPICDKYITHFTTYKNKIFGLYNNSIIYTFIKNDYKDCIEYTKEQILLHDNIVPILYINTCYNAKTMTPEFIVFDSDWNYYIYPLNYDGYIDKELYILKGSFGIKDGVLLHAFQRDSYWYIIRTNNTREHSATYLDIYFPDRTFFATHKLYDDICVDAIIKGFIVYLLFDSTIVLYNILNKNTQNIFDQHAKNSHAFKTLLMHCPQSLFVTDDKHIYEINIHTCSIKKIIACNTEIVTCCYPKYDIKSNTHHTLFPYVASKYLEKNNLLWKTEKETFDNLCNGIYDISFISHLDSLNTSFTEYDTRFIYEIIESKSIESEKNIKLNLHNLQQNIENYLSVWLCSLTILSKTTTDFYNILENLQNKVLIEFVKNTNIFGDSFIIYYHPSTKILHFVPDHSDWMKIFSYDKNNIKIPLQFYVVKGERKNMICRMIKGQRCYPHVF